MSDQRVFERKFGGNTVVGTPLVPLKVDNPLVESVVLPSSARKVVSPPYGATDVDVAVSQTLQNGDWTELLKIARNESIDERYRAAAIAKMAKEVYGYSWDYFIEKDWDWFLAMLAKMTTGVLV